MTTVYVDAKKPLCHMTPLELTHYRLLLEVGDGETEASQDPDKFEQIGLEFKSRGMIANAERCLGRARFYREQEAQA